MVKLVEDQKPSANNYGHDTTIMAKGKDQHQHVLILASNDHEIHCIWSYRACWKYNAKFPKLEELLADPFRCQDYEGGFGGVCMPHHIELGLQLILLQWHD